MCNILQIDRAETAQKDVIRQSDIRKSLAKQALGLVNRELKPQGTEQKLRKITSSINLR